MLHMWEKTTIKVVRKVFFFKKMSENHVPARTECRELKIYLQTGMSWQIENRSSHNTISVIHCNERLWTSVRSITIKDRQIAYP